MVNHIDLQAHVENERAKLPDVLVNTLQAGYTLTFTYTDPVASTKYDPNITLLMSHREHNVVMRDDLEKEKIVNFGEQFVIEAIWRARYLIEQKIKGDKEGKKLH